MIEINENKNKGIKMLNDLKIKETQINEIRSQLGWGDVNVSLYDGCYWIKLNGKQVTFKNHKGQEYQGNADTVGVALWLDALLKHNKKCLEGGK